MKTQNPNENRLEKENASDKNQETVTDNKELEGISSH